MEPIAAKEEIIADLKALQECYPHERITRNFYRIHGFYKESQWQYHFPTFASFLGTLELDSPARYVAIKELTKEDMLGPWIDMTSYDIGDIVFIGSKRHKITAKGPAYVRTKRQYWYHDLLDWLDNYCP